MMNEYIIPLPHNDPRLLSNVSQAFSLVDLGKRLLDAAKNGDVESVKNLISSGAPFTTDWLGISPLHFAAMNGHLSSCDALLRAGISRDARTKVDRTPLHLAAQEGHADIVELLLQNGADIGANDMLKMTALHWAAERGHTPVVQMLMRFGADPDVQNKFEMSPLNIAESKGYREVRDGMLNTQYDMLPSVGRMAAMNGDIAHANVYILTDEETLVPAAPPADEVIVTATNVTENDAANSILKPNELLSLESNSPLSVGKQQQNYKQRDMHKAGVDNNINIITTTTTSKSTGSDRNGAGLDCDLNIKLEDNNNNNNQNNDDDLLLPIGEYDSRDLMIVETPDGETFYIQHHANLDGPNSVVILNSEGESVQNPNLVAEVLDALDSIPDTHLTEMATPDSTQTIIDNPNFEKEDSQDTSNSKETSSKYPKLIYNSNDNNSDSNYERTIMKKSRAHTRQAKIYSNRCSKLNSLDAKREEKQNELPDNHHHHHHDHDPQTSRDNDLIAQLAEFADQSSIERIAFNLDGAEANTSTNDLMMWCLCNGLFVRDCSETTFVVEFVHNNTEYALATTYDPETGSILFCHIEPTDQCLDA